MVNSTHAPEIEQEALPGVYTIRFFKTQGETVLQFRLMYSGPLPSSGASNTPIEKHKIRKEFHKQLSLLWNQHSILKGAITGGLVDRLATDFSRCGYRFVPLIREEQELTCSVDILFLRHDTPGRIVSNYGGDLDNRLKVLFDALRLPTNCGELKAFSTPDVDEDPFFCLLEDDNLITSIRVTTDRLLLPLPASGGDVNDVYLMLTVDVVAGDSGDWLFC